MGGSKKITIGYKYFLGLHAALCYGKTKLKKILIGEKEVWSGTLIGNEHLKIDKYNLFGGEAAEGGVICDVWFLDGEQTEANAYMKRQLGEDMPHYKGLAQMVIHGMVASMNPYPKPWTTFVETIEDYMGVGNNYAIDGVLANPAQILYKVLTDIEFGKGIASNKIDKASFQKAAIQLQKESFGLCGRWEQPTTINEFIQYILDIIDGTHARNPANDVHYLLLIRDDYNIDTLPILTEDEIIEIIEFSRDSSYDIGNEVTITYEDYKTGIQKSITERNTGALSINPMPNGISFEYLAIPTQDLARRVATRELRKIASTPAKVKLRVTRAASLFTANSCFKIQYKLDGFNIENIILRIIDVSIGTSSDNVVTLTCIEDIYGMPSTKFIEQENEWKPPSTTPSSINVWADYELPYYLVNSLITEDLPSKWGDLTEGFSFLATCVQQPSGVTLGYHRAILNGGDYERADSISFTDCAVLEDNVDDITDTLNYLLDGYGEIEKDMLALIGSELIFITSFDDKKIVVKRGCLDTVPLEHTKGAIIWLVGGYDNALDYEFVKGQAISYKMQSYTNSEDYPLSACPIRKFTFQNRATLPIAPANIKVDSIYRVKIKLGLAKTITWARRSFDYVGGVVGQQDGDYIPEVGVSYVAQCHVRRSFNSSYVNLGIKTGLLDTSLELLELWASYADSIMIKITLWSQKDIDGITTNSWTQNIIEFLHVTTIEDIINEPPVNVLNWRSYIIGDNPTGEFLNKKNQVAVRYMEKWNFPKVEIGLVLKNAKDGFNYIYSSTGWNVI